MLFWLLFFFGHFALCDNDIDMEMATSETD